MLAAMPLRAISGYFVGQASVPSFNIIISIFCLKKELSVPAKPYWTQETFKKFTLLLVAFSIWGTTSGFYGLVESTVIRQQLPDIDSAGYYMATRFSEMATYLYGAMIFAFFPYAADLAQKGDARLNFTFKATGINIAFCAAVAVLFCFIAKPILSILPYGEQYASYWWAIPWLIAIAGISSLYGFFTTAEIAANRFGFLKWAIPLDITYPALLLMISSHRYFADMLPASLAEFLARYNLSSLETILWWMTAIHIIKAFVCLITMIKAKSHEAIPQ
jgi:O-antigen/teichoic acid export membrane protein